MTVFHIVKFLKMRCRLGLLFVLIWSAAALVGSAYAKSVNERKGAGGPSVTRSGVYVDGNRIYRNGRQFIARGVIFEGFLEPVSQLSECASASPKYCQRHLQTRKFYFGQDEYANGKDALSLAIGNWNINAVRFNLDQAALDPANASYDPEYLSEIRRVVAKAKQADLVIFLALFGTAAQGDKPEWVWKTNPPSPLDTDVTLHAAVELAKTFGDDPDVLIELLNEPWPPTSLERGYELWLNGGVLENPRSPFNGYAFPGVAKIVREARAAGSKNPIVVQGIGGTMEKIPGDVPDPLGKIVYSLHAFLEAPDSFPWQLRWDERFGNFAKTHPFIMTAWGLSANATWCERLGVKAAFDYLQYLSTLQIGILVYAFDVPYTLTYDFRKDFDKPTTFGAACSKVGSGDLVKAYFHHQPLRSPQMTDVTPPRLSLQLNPSDATIPEGTTVLMQADAQDDGGVSSIDFLVNKRGLSEPVRSPPYQLEWRPKPGEYNVMANARDFAGNQTYTDPINIKVVATKGLEVQGPRTLKVGEEGSWKVVTKNTPHGRLGFQMWWGDKKGRPSPSADTFQDADVFSYTYDKPGRFPLRARAMDAGGEIRETTLEVRVEARP